MFFINCKPCKSLRECWLLGSAWLKITAIYSWCFILNHFYTTQLSQVNNLPPFSHNLAHQSPLVPAATFKEEEIIYSLNLRGKVFTLCLIFRRIRAGRCLCDPLACIILLDIPHTLKNTLFWCLWNGYTTSTESIMSVMSSLLYMLLLIFLSVMHMFFVLVHSCFKVLYLTY